jgi:hypothetical protein
MRVAGFDALQAQKDFQGTLSSAKSNRDILAYQNDLLVAQRHYWKASNPRAKVNGKWT